ncbi:transmembrane protein 138 isoform X2 [Chiroxiphia lanceolata]|uniref:transmembrane protein 138 isoform X2 n=1 Tax=Chiroxiphia lanceolata TaxID=296741 RepID=UPI0013CE4599|nr:transmembrane protein 138 isoform X2 [Chiroxiphia lanceolata]
MGAFPNRSRAYSQLDVPPSPSGPLGWGSPKLSPGFVPIPPPPSESLEWGLPRPAAGVIPSSLSPSDSLGRGPSQTAPGVIPGFPFPQNLRWRDSSRFIWTEGLQTLFVFQRLAAVLYCYFYKRTAVHLGDPLFYQDSLWLRQEFAHFRG